MSIASEIFFTFDFETYNMRLLFEMSFFINFLFSLHVNIKILP